MVIYKEFSYVLDQNDKKISMASCLMLTFILKVKCWFCILLSLKLTHGGTNKVILDSENMQNPMPRKKVTGNVTVLDC